MIGTLLVPLVSKVLDRVIPDQAQRERAKLELLTQEQNGTLREIESSMQVIVAEAKGESWLQRNWRPITMMAFVGLIIAKWLGFTVESVTQDIELALLDIIKVGLGGYVLGRSAEKVVKVYKSK